MQAVPKRAGKATSKLMKCIGMHAARQENGSPGVDGITGLIMSVGQAGQSQTKQDQVDDLHIFLFSPFSIEVLIALGQNGRHLFL